MATTSQGPRRLQTVPNAGDVFGESTPRGIGNLRGSMEGPLEEVHIFWVAGMSCDGCSVAVTGATNPSVEELLAGTIPGLPRAVLHHPVLSVSAGAGFMKPFHAAANGELGVPYVVVIEGSIPDDQAFEGDSGYYSAMGAGGFDPLSEGDQPNRMTDWVLKLAPGAAAMVAIGTCATWGGIPAAAGNVTGSMSLTDFLGEDYRSTLGVPIVNVPGCSPVGDNFTEVVAGLLMFLQGIGPLPEFDELGRPAWQFKETVHRHCARAGYYEEGEFAEMPGDQECLVDVGCWGPVVQCNITERGAINHMGGCMIAGGACIGCTMPGFPDKFAPFYKAPPGSFISGSVSRTTGAGIRRLRRMSQANLNRSALWDQTGHVPSAFGKEMSGPTPVQRVSGFFYKKLQYRGTADVGKANKAQPLPKTLNILQHEPEKNLERTVPTNGQGVHVEETN